MAMKVRPLGDHVLVTRDEKIDKTESGLYLPESAKDTPKTGKIEAVGQGHYNEESGKFTPFTVKKGDRVLFTSYAGTEVKLDGKELLLMQEKDILAIVDD